MEMINEEIIERLCETASAPKSDWAEFDSILDSIEDINVVDDDEETYLSYCIRYADYYEMDLVETITRFISKGYDVKANDGLNGGICLSRLCYLKLGDQVMRAAKALLAAGAPTEIYSIFDEPEELLGVLKDIDCKAGDNWVLYKDYSFANTMEAYRALVNAVNAGKPFGVIDTYHCCIGKRLEKVEILGKDEQDVLCDGVIEYRSPLALWFDGKPLILSIAADFVVDPNVVTDNLDNAMDVSEFFARLIGAALTGITYLNRACCYLQFDNGMRMFVMSSLDKDDKAIGLIEIREEETVLLSDIDAKTISFWGGATYPIVFRESAECVIALQGSKTTTLIFAAEDIDHDRHIEAVKVSNEFARDFVRRLSVERPEAIELYYCADGLKALRIQCGDEYLYAQTCNELLLEVRLSKERIMVQAPDSIRNIPGIRIQFRNTE